MAFVLRSNVYQLSTTTGNGSTIALLNDTVTVDGVDYGKFSDFMSNGDRTWIKRWMGSAWEELLVEYSSGSLTVVSVLASTNGGAQIDWGAGTKRVFCALPATEARFLGSRVQGDLLYGGATGWERLPNGVAGQFLRQNAGLTAPEWATVITPWVPYTPTFTGFGTVSGLQIFSRRVGDTLQVRGRFIAGTTTAVRAEMTLGYNGTNGNVTVDNGKMNSLALAGDVIASATGAAILYALSAGSRSYLTFGYQNAGSGALTEQNGNSAFGSSTTISIMAEVPITGW